MFSPLLSSPLLSSFLSGQSSPSGRDRLRSAPQQPAEASPPPPPHQQLAAASGGAETDPPASTDSEIFTLIDTLGFFMVDETQNMSKLEHLFPKTVLKVVVDRWI